MCMAFAHLAIILSFMQRYEEYLLALKAVVYSFSSGYKRQYASKSKDVIEMNDAKGIKLHDLILPFILLLITDVDSIKSFLGSECKVFIWNDSEFS